MAKDRTSAEPDPADTSAEVRDSELWAEGMRLGPWHLDVEIAPGLRTRDFAEAGPEVSHSFYDPAPRIKSILQSVYPAGLEGRRVLDCACNNGAFLFAAKDIGAGECFGVDVRGQWIDQAEFLLRHREGPTGGVQFRTMDLYDLPALDLEPFDVTIFSGVLYHLPDPIRGLQIAADLTSEIIFVSTAAKSNLPDGMLVAGEEPIDAPTSGVFGLQWYPTGPTVITRMLRYMGFEETRCCGWRRSRKHPELDLVQVIAGRERGSLDRFDAQERGVMDLVQTTVRPRSTLLVATQGDPELRRVPDRRAWHFPQDETGAYDPSLEDDSHGLMVLLDRLRAAGAEYLLVPWDAVAWLDRNAEFRSHLERRHRLVARQDGTCLLFDLTG